MGTRELGEEEISDSCSIMASLCFASPITLEMEKVWTVEEDII